MHPPRWLRRHAYGIFQAFVVVFLMLVAVYATVALVDEQSRPRLLDMVVIFIVAVLSIMVLLARMRWAGQPDPTPTGIPAPRSPGPVYRATHPVASLAAPARTDHARDRFEHTVPLSRTNDGRPNGDEAAGFMRGLLASEEDLGDGPPDWRGAT